MQKHLLAICCMLVTATLFANQPKVILYPNGNKHFEYEVKNDLYNGPFTSYFENGKVRMTGCFSNNQKTGVWTTWDANGIMRSQRKYADDYTFEILNEWNDKGVAVAPEVIQQKNERIIGARSKGIIEKQSIYMQRFWKEIDAGNASNAFLFKDNFFFQFLLTEATGKRMYIFEEDRFVHPVNDFKELLAYKNVSPAEYIVKKEIVYTKDHEVMHTRVIGICPVVLVNGEKKQLGWFYVPDVRNNRMATDRVEDIITNLEKNNYAGTVVKTTIGSQQFEGREVVAADTDAINLSTLDYEAGVVIYLMDKSLAGK